MTKFFFKRLLRGAISVIIVVAIIMILIYSLLDRKLVFAQDSYWTKISANDRTMYEYQMWENYGYIDLVTYQEWLTDLVTKGEIDSETRNSVANIGNKAADDSVEVAAYINKFTEYYKSLGYKVRRIDAKMKTATTVFAGFNKYLFAYRDRPLISRLWSYFTGMITVDNIHYVKDDVGERGVKFTLFDPAYGGDTFAPAIIGNGTKYKYLLYVDGDFPFIHQNLVSINLGWSYTVTHGVDVWNTMTDPQGRQDQRAVTYPTGVYSLTADNIHTAKYVAGSKDKVAMVKDENGVQQPRFTDDYTDVVLYKSGMSKMGYSFVIGILAAILSYMLGIPIGIIMARNKDKLIDKIGTFYIIFIIAVPSLAYIFLFRAIGGGMGLPTTFMMEDVGNVLMYVLPVVSLALPAVAGLMRWLRRYMIDQMNSDYVKFARSGGLSESEIFSKHIFKNAAIPIVHNIPGNILGALVGAIITERVYVVPGAGGLLPEAINKYDNGVIIGVTLFYAVLSVVSIILGDILMAMVDPRISFSTKAR